MDVDTLDMDCDTPMDDCDTPMITCNTKKANKRKRSDLILTDIDKSVSSYGTRKIDNSKEEQERLRKMLYNTISFGYGSEDYVINRVKNILAEGLDLNIRDDMGITPLHRLCILSALPINTQCKLAKIFIEHGADVNSKDKAGLDMLFYLCLHNSHRDNYDLMKFLINNGLDVKYKVTNGYSPVILMIRDGLYPRTIEYLLKNGARLPEKYKYIEQALDRKYNGGDTNERNVIKNKNRPEIESIIMKYAKIQGLIN